RFGSVVLEELESGLYLGELLGGADDLEPVDGFAPRRLGRARIANGAGDFAELAEHFRVQQTIFSALRFENRDAESSNALVEGSTLALDGRADLEGAGCAQVV